MDTIMEKRLSEANDLREAEKYGEASKVYTECLIDLVQSGDPAGLIHCLGGQSLIYKNLITKNNSPVYHQLCVSFAKQALEIGESYKENIDGRTLSIAYSCYGDSLLTIGETQKALSYFEKAFSASTAGAPEKGRLKAHIGGIKFSLGDKENGLKMLDESLLDIRTGDLNNITIRTWETGSLNGLAMVYAVSGEKTKALSIAQESLAIAEKYNLTIRKRQTEDIIKKISFDCTDFSI